MIERRTWPERMLLSIHHAIVSIIGHGRTLIPWISRKRHRWSTSWSTVLKHFWGELKLMRLIWRLELWGLHVLLWRWTYRGRCLSLVASWRLIVGWSLLSIVRLPPR